MKTIQAKKREKKRMAKGLIIIFILAYIISYAQPLLAGIGVMPTITEITVAPSSVTKGVFKIANSDPDTIVVTVEVEDWLKKRVGIDIGVPVEEWFTITPTEFEVAPQEVVEIDYEIKAPANVSGELIAMIFFAAEVPTKGAMGITSRFGVSIYAGIEGSLDVRCNLHDVEVHRNIVKKDEGGDLDKGIVFILRLENEGNVHTRPVGNIVISDDQGEAVGGIPIPRSFPVFPGRKISYNIPWDKTDLPEGEYEAKVRLDYGKLYNIDGIIERTVSFLVDQDGMISF